MPIHEYACSDCQHRFEYFLRPPDTAPPDTLVCPACGSRNFERQLSAFAVNSASTQQAHLRQARKVGARSAFDKKQSETEQIRRIEAEHHDH